MGREFLNEEPRGSPEKGSVPACGVILRVILGLYWDYTGVILGLYWGYISTLLWGLDVVELTGAEGANWNVVNPAGVLVRN